MESLLPWWLLVVPAILILVDSIVSPKTSSMGSGTALVPTPITGTGTL